VVDNPRFGRLSMSINDDSMTLVRELIRVNRRLAVRDVSAEVGILTVRAKPF
jgi:hypothetical protein